MASDIRSIESPTHTCIKTKVKYSSTFVNVHKVQHHSLCNSIGLYTVNAASFVNAKLKWTENVEMEIKNLFCV